MLKSRLRAEIRLRRQSLDETDRRSLNESINKSLLKLVEETGIVSLSGFWPFDGEPDMRPALEILSRRGLKIALPVISDTGKSSVMQFRQWSHTETLKINRFGIEEPGAGKLVSVDDLDLVLLPLVSWDEKGRRLGMGAAYYDRALAELADSARPLRVGVAYELQKVPELPEEPWDIRLHQVLTENGRFTCVG